MIGRAEQQAHDDERAAEMQAQQPEWNAERVRDELPDVVVKAADGKLHTCRVRGRMLPFASLYSPGNEATTLHVAWRTLADCLNRNVPLQG